MFRVSEKQIEFLDFLRNKFGSIEGSIDYNHRYFLLKDKPVVVGESIEIDDSCTIVKYRHIMDSNVVASSPHITQMVNLNNYLSKRFLRYCQYVGYLKGRSITYYCPALSYYDENYDNQYLYSFFDVLPSIRRICNDYFN